MKIQTVSNQSFGVSYYLLSGAMKNRDRFYELSDSDKLDVIYHMLKDQNRDIVELSKNQQKIQTCNDLASMTLLNNITGRGANEDGVYLGRKFDNNRINLLG